MRRALQTTPILAAILVAATLAPSWAVAQGTPPKTPTPAPTATPTPAPAQSGTQQALRGLQAWQKAPARQTLEAKQASEGSSAAFKTAWGLLRAEEGKLDEGLTSLAAAATADPKDPAPEYFRGQILAWQTKHNDAKAAYQRALDRARAAVTARPDDARALYFQGAAQVRLQSYQAARDALNAARAKGFDPTLVDYQIALSYTYEQKWQQAKDTFDAVLAADPAFAHAYYYRGRVWRELKRTDQMMVDLDTFVRMAPDAPEAANARSLLAAGGG